VRYGRGEGKWPQVLDDLGEFAIDLTAVAVRIETERDPERLRQIALLLERENQHLHRRLAELTRKLAQATGSDAIADLQLELRLVEEQLEQRNQALFGRSSEKRGRAREGNGTAKAQTGHGPRAQAELPIAEQVHVLDEPDRMCPQCGGDLREITGQYEESEEVDVVARSFRLVRHRRQKYRCQCGECVETALGPPKLIAGGRYSVAFAIEVAIAKYCDHMPLARQVRQMKRAGLVTDTQTLWDQLFALYRHLAPIGEAVHALVLTAPVVAPDETRWPLLGEPGQSKWHAWSVASPRAISYRIEPSRSAEAARGVLGSYAGCVIADGYGVYGAVQEALARERDGPTFDLAHCWVHCRRKFVEAERHHPVAAEMIEKIGRLYAVEAEVCALPEKERGRRLAELRRERSKPVVDEIYQWITTTRALPQSSLGKALAYTQSLWPGLVRFLENAAIPLDTNAVERGMRAVALGRKNHYGSRSERGTRVAALFYTLIESARMVDVEPASYLTEAARRAIPNPGTVTLPGDLLSD
jgi:transposase